MQNILLDESGNILISDYGTCKIAKFEFTQVSGTISATLRFAPPELLIDRILSGKVKN